MNEYKSHDEFIKYLKDNKSEECKNIIKSFDNMQSMDAIVSGISVMEVITIMLNGPDLNIVVNVIKLLLVMTITLVIGISFSRLVIGRKYLNYIKENNIKILDIE